MLPGDAASVHDYYDSHPRLIFFRAEADTGRHGAKGGRAVSAWWSFCLYLKSYGISVSRNAGRRGHRYAGAPARTRSRSYEHLPGLR